MESFDLGYRLRDMMRPFWNDWASSPYGTGLNVQVCSGLLLYESHCYWIFSVAQRCTPELSSNPRSTPAYYPNRLRLNSRDQNLSPDRPHFQA